MKTTRYLFLILLMTLVGMSAKAQQRNVLQLPDVTSQIGNAQLPVSIENTDEIVGAQFDLTLPDGVTAEAIGVLANRSDGHTVTVSRLNSGVYRVLLHSTQNRPLRGQSGLVMYLPINISNSFEEGSEHPLAITNAVLGKATGENVLTEALAGMIKISKLPDLTVKNISCDKQTVTPGERITCSWQVENIGERATGGGWSEQVSLVSNDESQSKLIATTHYDGTINAGGIVSRQTEIALPILLGIDGQARLQVRIVPDSDTGESTSAQGNNTQTGSSIININKVLTLELSPNRVEEKSSRRIALRVNRSGRWTEAETFAITATADTRISIPTSTTIPAGHSGTIIYIQVSDNNILDKDSIINISVDGSGYTVVEQSFIIEDNEYPDLAIVTSKSVVTEGEIFQLTISTSRISTVPIAITLSSEDKKRFLFPATVDIPAGQTSVTIYVMTTDDDIPSLDFSNVFTVSAQRYNKAETIVLLQDDDMPVLELTLTPNKVSENVGPVSIAGKLRRTTNKDSKIIVKLSDDSEGGLYFGNRTMELAKGVDEVYFNFGPIDNTQVDGDRAYTVTAAVWLSSCSCGASGESAGSVAAQLNVLDDDGPALTLTSSQSTLKEGDKTMLTITRNTNANVPLVINLNSDYDGLSFNHTVTIPEGEQSATLEVFSPKNDINGDGRTVVLTASADGFSTGTCWLMLTDQTLPDARISTIRADKKEAKVGEPATISLDLTNDGIAELPSSLCIKIYRKGNSNAVATLYTDTPIAAGQSETLTKILTISEKVGLHTYYATVNDANKVAELSYANNTSEEISIESKSPYSASVNTDKSIYEQGEKVMIEGQLTGRFLVGSEVEVYIINQGVRQSAVVTVDENGAFSKKWELYALQSGHFSAGACYPGEDLRDEMASFDVYGLKRTNNGYITHYLTTGKRYNGTIEISNPGNLDLTRATAELISVPENCEADVSIPSTIKAGETTLLTYTLTGTSSTEGNNWQEVKARVNTAEGAILDVTINFYCRNAKATLVASTQNLNTTVVKGQPRDYVINVSNQGEGNTGRITLALPNWISSLTGSTIPSLSLNDTATVVLRFTPTDDMQLNVPVTGKFGFNCENGDGTYVNFNITPVSEVKGVLVIDVTDEYTYYTSEAPHVEGAQVVVCNPITNALVAQGVTGDDGKCTLELNQGYYRIGVTADNHSSYANIIYVDPGKETLEIVNLSIEAIRVSWNVEETEVEDKYEIVTKVKYETNVPVPVVVINGPDKIDADAMGVGESVLLNFVLTNKGLIQAEDVEFYLPGPSSEFTFTALESTGPFDLAPQSAKMIPVLLTRTSNAEARSKGIRAAGSSYLTDCMAGFSDRYKWMCGTELRENRAAFSMALRACTIGTIMNAILSNFGGGLSAPNGGGGRSYGDETVLNGVGRDRSICNPEVAEAAKNLIGNALGFTPLIGPIISIANGTMDAVEEQVLDGTVSPGTIASLGTSFAVPFFRVIGRTIGNHVNGQVGQTVGETVGEAIGTTYDVAQLLYSMVDFANEISGNVRGISVRKARSSSVSWLDDYYKKAGRLYDELSAIFELEVEYFGNPAWYMSYDKEIETFFKVLQELPCTFYDVSELMSIKPSSISEKQFTAFIERLNNTLSQAESENKINMSHFESIANQLSSMEESAINEGYLSTLDMYNYAVETVQEEMDKQSQTVCSSITLQFKQTMTTTRRQAFRGTLTLFNGNETTPMSDIKLNLNITSNSGIVATVHEFQINAESLNGFSGEVDLASGWTLESGGTGTATILFVPTKYAAPDGPVDWSFGGTLSYIDPFTGLEVTRELYPVTLTVKPSPELDLTYFMQRDVIGDDPLTEVLEPTVPAEFALVINNKGNGDATNLRMVTQQPEIIENEKGLLINFELVNSQVNGGDATLSFGQSIANDFGTIPAHSQMYAQWWLQSSLLGHFTDYDVQATHVTSYGNEDLSLLDQVTIHELIHGFTVKNDGNRPVRGFLVNDVVDAEDLPDEVYFTDATQQGAYIATNANIVKQCDTEFVLNVNAASAGWNYGSLLDPTYGKQKLVKVTRADGTEVNVDNIWQTGCTLRDGKDPLYEKRLHFVGNMSAEGETFYLTFEPKPELELEVESYAGVPEEGTVLKEQLRELTIKFNKLIKAESFTTEDITINCQGVAQDASQIVIEQVTESEYKLTLNEVSLLDGYYVLNVQTAGIEDSEGFNGSTGKQVSWIQFIDGKVAIKVAASPSEGGTVTPDSGRFDYDSDVTLKAVAAEGYDFICWKTKEEIVGNMPEFNCHLSGYAELTAIFKPKHYDVNIECNETQGSVSNAASGIYDFGTSLQIIAVSQPDFVFTGWVINEDSVINGSDTLIVTVDKELNIRANFMREIYHQSITMKYGWNWMSTYMGEPLDINEVIPYANRIVGQFDELIFDPKYGMVGGLDFILPGKAYKIETKTTFTKSFGGHIYHTETMPISLRTGWNWIAYPYMERASVGSVIANASEGDYIATQTGFAEYFDGYWEGTLDMFEPGVGYLYKSTTDKDLVFDFTSVTAHESRTKRSSIVVTTDEEVDVHRYPNTMNITARLYKDGLEQTGGDYLVYAMANNELRGISQYRGNNYYLTVYGDEPIEITLICESTETGNTYIANETVQFKDDVIGSRKSPFAISFGDVTGIEQLDYEQKPITVYSLEGILVGRNMSLKMIQKLPKGVYIVNGQKCYVK